MKTIGYILILLTSLTFIRGGSIGYYALSGTETKSFHLQDESTAEESYEVEFRAEVRTESVAKFPDVPDSSEEGDAETEATSPEETSAAEYTPIIDSSEEKAAENESPTETSRKCFYYAGLPASNESSEEEMGYSNCRDLTPFYYTNKLHTLSSDLESLENEDLSAETSTTENPTEGTTGISTETSLDEISTTENPAEGTTAAETSTEQNIDAAFPSMVVVVVVSDKAGKLGTPSPAGTEVTETPTTGPISYPCTEAGNYPDPGGNCTIYYKCINQGKWLHYLFNCPEGSTFDASNKICLIGNGACALPATETPQEETSTADSSVVTESTTQGIANRGFPGETLPETTTSAAEITTVPESTTESTTASESTTEMVPETTTSDAEFTTLTEFTEESIMTDESPTETVLETNTSDTEFPTAVESTTESTASSEVTEEIESPTEAPQEEILTTTTENSVDGLMTG